MSKRHRITKAWFKFVDLTTKERKQFYKEDVDHVFDCLVENLIAFEASMRVALSYITVVTDCDRGRIKTTVNSRLVASRDFKKFLLQSLP